MKKGKKCSYTLKADIILKQLFLFRPPRAIKIIAHRSKQNSSYTHRPATSQIQTLKCEHHIRVALSNRLYIRQIYCAAYSNPKHGGYIVLILTS